MEYLFKIWNEAIIQRSCHRKSTGEIKLGTDQDDVQSAGTESIKLAMTKTVVESSSDRKGKFIIQRHQAALFNLLDSLEDMLVDNPKDEGTECLTQLRDEIILIWDFMIKEFKLYIDVATNLPPALRLHYKTSLQPKIAIVSNSLDLIHNLDQTFVGVVARTFEKWMEPGQIVNMKDIFYIMEIIENVGTMLANTKHEDLYEYLEGFFLTTNFGDIHLYRDVVQRVDSTLFLTEDIEAQQTYLRNKLDFLSLLPDSINKSKKHGTLLKKRFESFLLKKLRGLETGNGIQQPDKFHLKFNTTVKVLAVLGRACFDTKFIANDNKTEAYEWITNYISTFGIDSVSYKTLIKRGSRPEDRDKELAKDIIMKLVMQINKY